MQGVKGRNTKFFFFFGCSENKESLINRNEHVYTKEKKKINVALKAMKVTGGGTILADVCQTTSVKKNHEIARYVHLKATDHQSQ